VNSLACQASRFDLGQERLLSPDNHVHLGEEQMSIGVCPAESGVNYRGEMTLARISQRDNGNRPDQGHFKTSPPWV